MAMSLGLFWIQSVISGPAFNTIYRFRRNDRLTKYYIHSHDSWVVAIAGESSQLALHQRAITFLRFSPVY